MVRIATVALLGVFAMTAAGTQRPGRAPVRGLSEAPALAGAYDAILNADFDQVPVRLASACRSVPTFCQVMDAVSVWWQIALNPEARGNDGRFSRSVEQAIADATAWTLSEPERAEAWFALGGAYGARAQWRVLRKQRLSAARDGKRIKEALERALAIDPELHDAKFGIGMYRYYAAVAPVTLRMLRWLFLLPGGDRSAGLGQMLEAYTRGTVIRGEAEYQLHLVYLWYEHRSLDALALVRGLQTRYPRNPLFYLIEAEIHDVYFHDVKTSEAVLHTLITHAQTGRVNAAELALQRARASLTALHARARQ